MADLDALVDQYVQKVLVRLPGEQTVPNFCYKKSMLFFLIGKAIKTPLVSLPTIVLPLRLTLMKWGLTLLPVI